MRTRIILILLLVFVLSFALVGAQMLSSVTIPSSGTIWSPSQGEEYGIYFMDSFEDETPRRFDWSTGGEPAPPPIGWIPDVSDDHGAYMEVSSSPEASYDGNIGIFTSAPAWDTSTQSWIAVQLAEVDDSFYVSWYEKFETLPDHGYVDIFVMAASYLVGGVHRAQTNRIAIYRSGASYGISMAQLYGSADVGSSYPFQTGVWYHFETFYKCGVNDGEYKLWIDGSLILSATGIDTTPTDGLEYRPAGFEVGLDNYMKDESFQAWIDYVIVAKQRGPPVLYYTGFETGHYVPDFDIGLGNYGGRIEESTTIVHNGESARRVYALKTWQWQSDTLVDLRTEDGTQILGQVRVGDTVPSQVGTWHFTGDGDPASPNPGDWGRDFIYQKSGGTYDWQQFNPRARIVLLNIQDGTLTDVYMRAYVYIAKLSSGWFELMEWYSYVSSHFVHVEIHDFNILLRLEAPSGVQETQANIGALNPNQWYCIECRFTSGVSGGAQLWVDGELVVDITPFDTSGINIELLSPQVGTNISHIYSQGQNDGMEIYIDDFAVATNYIGP
jgi:hypothetical protein